MVSVRTISLTLFLLEALILLFPSFWGFAIAAMGICEFIVVPKTIWSLFNLAAYLMLFFGLCSLWRILFWVVSNGQDCPALIPKLCWQLATFTAVLTLISPLFDQNKVSVTVWYECGYLYLPSYLHLLFETKRIQRIKSPIKMLKPCRQKI